MANSNPGKPGTPIICPSCSATPLALDNGHLICTSRTCQHEVPRAGKVHDLDVDAGDTRLDVADYTAQNFANEQSYRNLFADLDRIVTEIMGDGDIDQTLEIGAGSGAWTWGLSRSERFHNLYATDISHGFLSLLADHCDAPGTLVMRAPGESLRFQPDSLDLVLGRSVLHHIHDYPALLEQVRGWLKPGGVAIFFEPCLQGKLWVAFFMDAIRRIDEQARQRNETLDEDQRRPTLSTDAKRRLEGGMRHILKDFYHADIEQIRPNIEDKYVFDIQTLLDQARASGFREAGHISLPQNGGLALTRIKNTLKAVLKDEQAILDQYTPLFDAFSATFGIDDMTPPIAPMVYFWFRA